MSLIIKPATLKRVRPGKLRVASAAISPGAEPTAAFQVRCHQKDCPADLGLVVLIEQWAGAQLIVQYVLYQAGPGLSLDRSAADIVYRQGSRAKALMRRGYEIRGSAPHSGNADWRGKLDTPYALPADTYMLEDGETVTIVCTNCEIPRAVTLDLAQALPALTAQRSE
jgi:hypothetical protein